MPNKIEDANHRLADERIIMLNTSSHHVKDKQLLSFRNVLYTNFDVCRLNVLYTNFDVYRLSVLYTHFDACRLKQPCFWHLFILEVPAWLPTPCEWFLHDTFPQDLPLEWSLSENQHNYCEEPALSGRVPFGHAEETMHVVKLRFFANARFCDVILLSFIVIVAW